jgi:hypothetical protein
MAQLFNRLGQLGLGVALAGGVIQSALFNVDGGHRAVIFDRFQGVKQDVVGEGTHFMIPWVQRPILFDIRYGGRQQRTKSQGIACRDGFHQLFLSIMYLFMPLGGGEPPVPLVRPPLEPSDPPPPCDVSQRHV